MTCAAGAAGAEGAAGAAGADGHGMPCAPRVPAVGLETIIVERAQGVVTVTMNRPERKNAANATMWQELLDAFVAFRRSSSDRVLVLTGAGGAFCSGADITDPARVNGNPEDHQLRHMQFLAEVALTLHQLPKPTVAKIGGVAAGAGLGLGLGCDLTVAGESARLSTIFSRRGLSVDCGMSFLLPRLVGMPKAKELAFLADMVSAAEAAAMGLVNRVVPDDQLDAFVDDWARRLAAGPPLALSMTKRLLDMGANTSMAEALEAEGWVQSVNFGSEDTAEALTAFNAKREPEFRGR